MLQAVRQRGFTLIEVIVVIALVALLMAYVAPNLLNRADDAKRKSAGLQLEKISSSIELYKLEVGRFPETLNDLVVRPSSQNSDSWNGPYLKKKSLLKDPWGNDLNYRQPGEHGAFDLFSFAGDGQSGGDGDNADITSWE